MATVYLVSPALVKKTGELLNKVQSARGTQRLMQDWVAQMDASGALVAEPVAEKASDRPDQLPEQCDQPDRSDRAEQT
jgi:hypothetical protein